MGGNDIPVQQDDSKWMQMVYNAVKQNRRPRNQVLLGIKILESTLGQVLGTCRLNLERRTSIHKTTWGLFQHVPTHGKTYRYILNITKYCMICMILWCSHVFSIWRVLMNYFFWLPGIPGFDPPPHLHETYGPLPNSRGSAELIGVVRVKGISW